MTSRIEISKDGRIVTLVNSGVLRTTEISAAVERLRETLLGGQAEALIVDSHDAEIDATPARLMDAVEDLYAALGPGYLSAYVPPPGWPPDRAALIEKFASEFDIQIAVCETAQAAETLLRAKLDDAPQG